MMKLLNKWKADYIITWKLNRLARNAIDEWAIKHTLQHWIIKAIYTQSEVFRTWDNVLIMWMHFWMSTQYILDLQADIKRWIKQKIANWWVCQKAPLWYINNKLEKSVEIDAIKSKWVKEIFKLRSQNMAYKTISDVLFEKWIKRDNWKPLPTTSIERLIKNKFYIGLVKHNWEYYKWNYKTFISKRIFEKAQNIWQWVHYRDETPRLYHLKWFLKDEEWYLLSWYNKKWHIYYKNSSRWINVNINQDKIFNHFLEKISHLEFDENFKVINKEIIITILENQKPKDYETIKEIDFKIKKFKEQKDKLLDLRIDWEIEKDVYTKKSNDLVLQIEDLENNKSELKKNNLKEKIDIMFELLESLSVKYKQADWEWKSIILKNLMFELFIDNKKELSYAEDSLLNSLILLQNTSKDVMEVPSGLEPE